jgi:hypothetical protein
MVIPTSAIQPGKNPRNSSNILDLLVGIPGQVRRRFESFVMGTIPAR